MAEDFERVGVQTVVEGISKFERDIGKYNASLDKMAMATKKAVAVIRKQQQYTKALEKAAFAVAKELKKVKDSNQAVAQSTKIATKGVREFTAAQGETLTLAQKVSRGLETEAEQMERLNKVVEEGIARLKEREAYRAPTEREYRPAVGIEVPMQEFATPEALVAHTKAVEDANTAWGNLVKGMSVAVSMQQKQEEVQKKQTSALMGNVKKLALYAIGIRAAYTLVSKFRRALMDGLRTLYETTDEYKRLTTATDQFKIALAAAAVPADTAADSITKIAEAVEWFNLAMLKASGVLRANVAFQKAWVNMIAESYQGIEKLATGIEVAEDDIRSIIAQPFIAWLDRFNTVVESGKKAMDEAGDAADKYSSQIRSMVSAMRRWEQASAAIAAKAGEIEAAYEEAVGVALGDLAISQMKVQTDLADTITDVHAKAAKDRAKAIADSQHAIERTVRQSQDNLAKAQEQHAIQMAHQRQRYNLSMIQSERMYLYQRGQLIAEGDVLALEDLDARHELEQDAREENFAMQERQAEELFQMQMRYQEQAIREQVAALRDGLTEQLREIKAREDEEIASAREAAAEKEAAAKEEYASALADAEAAAIEQREAQEAEQQKLLESTAQTLADVVTTTDLTTQQVLDAWHAVNGPDQALDQLVKQFVARDEEWTKQIGAAWGAAADTSLAAARRLTDGWATSLAAITANALAAAAAVAAIGAGGYSGAGGLGPRKRGRGWVRQYGGEDVVTTPTTMLVGEAGPERVVVQPLSSIGNMSGSFGLGWHGGPIPVQGSGLQGADTSGLGDAISQGLLVELRKQLLGFSGQRGY